jgi:hypothetical protein
MQESIWRQKYPDAVEKTSNTDENIAANVILTTNGTTKHGGTGTTASLEMGQAASSENAVRFCPEDRTGGILCGVIGMVKPSVNSHAAAQITLRHTREAGASALTRLRVRASSASDLLHTPQVATSSTGVYVPMSLCATLTPETDLLEGLHLLCV